MSNIKDFIVENGVLVKYSGQDEEVIVPDGVKEIGTGAFLNKGKIKKVIIPKSIKKIAYNAIDKCKMLTDVYYKGEIQDWLKIVFCSSFVQGANLYLNGELLTELVLPEGIKEIVRKSFWGCTSITRVVLSSSVKRIGEDAFYGCPNLRDIVLNDGIESIEPGAFVLCNSLREVYLPGSLKKCDAAFYQCSNLQRVVVGRGVDIIGINMFAHCTALDEVLLPEGVKSIKNDAFKNCPSLSKITLPSSILEICAGAFTKSHTTIFVHKNSYCEAWARKVKKDYRYIGDNFDELSSASCVAHDGFQIENHVLVKYFGRKRSVVIPDTVRCIGKDAFAQARINSIFIPDSVTEISESAFEDCDELSNIKMGSSVRIIGNKAFYGCSGLSEIILPDSIEYIGEDAFAECESDDGDMTVRGSYGGYAYKYCDKYGIPFFEYIFK